MMDDQLDLLNSGSASVTTSNNNMLHCSNSKGATEGTAQNITMKVVIHLITLIRNSCWIS